MRSTDPYELLGVPRDATPERIRRAYELEVARAHRDGALKHAVDLSAAYDTLSKPAARALYDRHGIAAVRERSPGAAPPPTPWRFEKQQPLAMVRGVRAPRGHWRMPTLTVFSLGLVAGLVLAAYVYQHTTRTGATSLVGRPVVHEHQVLCETTPAGPGYVYSAPVTAAPRCSNGARPRVLG